MGCGASKGAEKPWNEESYAKYDHIKKMWMQLDLDDSGFIEIRELKLHLSKQGKKVDKNSLALAFNLVDTDRSGKISFDEFCKHNGLTITDDVRKHLDLRGEAHFVDSIV